jgi:hypothetical protein
MKNFTYMLGVGICALFFATTARGDAFADFRTEVQRKIPSGWVCGEVRTIEGNTLFDVRSPKNRFSVIITRRELISQQEWNSRSERIKKAINAILAGDAPENIDGTAIKDGTDLPDGRYGGGAVSVGVDDSELWYPEIESDGQESTVVLKVILGTLELYNKSEQAGVDQPATAPQLKSESKEKPKPDAEVRPR